MIVEIAHRLLNAPQQLRTDSVAVVEHVGHGANGYLGSSCNLLDGGSALVNNDSRFVDLRVKVEQIELSQCQGD